MKTLTIPCLRKGDTRLLAETKQTLNRLLGHMQTHAADKKALRKVCRQIELVNYLHAVFEANKAP